MNSHHRLTSTSTQAPPKDSKSAPTKNTPSRSPSPSIIPHSSAKVKHKPFRTLLTILFLLFWTVFSIFSSQFIISFIFALLNINMTNSTTITTVFNALTYSLSLFILIFVPWKLFKKFRPTREDLGLANLPTFVDLGLAPVGFLVYYILASLLTSLFQLFPWFDATEAQDVGYNLLITRTDYIVTFLALAVIAPIAEEIIFRGWLYGHLRAKLPRKISLPLAIILVSILFGLLHGQVNVGINVFAMSVVLCIMREITGTIYSGILLHFIKNALAFYLIYILDFTY